MDDAPSPDPAIEAEALVAAYLGRAELPDPRPKQVAVVIDRLVRRAESAGAGGVASTSQTAGPYSYTQAFSPDAQAGGMWLNRTDKMLLGHWRKRGRAANVAMG